MRKRSARLGLWILLLYLPASKSSSLDNGTNCAVCSKEGGNHNPFCNQKISKQCDLDKGNKRLPNKPYPCYDTSGEVVATVGCTVVKLQEDEGCGALKSSHITPQKPLVHLHLYHHYSSSWGDEALVNLTLPAPSWKELKLQNTFIGSGFRDACRLFTLSEPVNSTLMFECPVMFKFGDKPMSTKLTVEADNGEGASYLFMIPPGLRIHPEKTCPSDWHVFFYIHQDALHSSDPLPVTIQSSPFGRVSYNVVLARCLDPENEECRDFEVLHSELESKDSTDDLWITYLPRVTVGGTYVIMVQMVSDLCPKDKGCYVSVSPSFDVPSSSAWIVLLLSICMVLMFLLSILIMIYQRQKINKEFFKAMKHNQPTVLLVYHPESMAALSFVSTLAEFLKNTCYVTCLMADDEVGNENPTNWTKNKMNEASHVLFVIPKDSEVPSFTTIRNQWKVALNHCNGDEFINNQKHVKRLAKLIHPASGSVPSEIRDVRRFEVSQNPSALANWIHDGSFLDQIFIWVLHIRSSARKNISPTWKNVKLAAQKVGSPPATPNSESLSPETSPTMCKERSIEIHSSDDDDDNEDYVASSEIDEVFDPCQESDSSPENSSGEDDIFQ